MQNIDDQISWEEAVRKLRTIPGQERFIKEAYLDEDNIEAAKRFEQSNEFSEVMFILKSAMTKSPPWRVLDIGAGNGIASYSFEKAGHSVIALEPDKSDDVGSGAIRRLKESLSLNIYVIEDSAEDIPLSDSSIDVVYIRQALHHADDLTKQLKEIHRVLVPGGVLIATREHVADNDEQLKEFLESHPLHKWYGGENAYNLKEYSDYIKQSGLKIVKVLGPFESVINFAPMTLKDIRSSIADKFKYIGFSGLLRLLFKIDLIWNVCAWVLTKAVRNPGRLYSFIALKPEVVQQ